MTASTCHKAIIVVMSIMLVGGGCATTSDGASSDQAARSCCAPVQSRVRRKQRWTGGPQRRAEAQRQAVAAQKAHWEDRSRWRLYTGIASMTIGLTGVGIGTAYMLRSNDRRDEAEVQSDSGARSRLLDQSEDEKTIGIMGLAIGIPLVLAGTTLMILDLVDTPSREETAKSWGIAPTFEATDLGPMGGAAVFGRF